ncbi:hypothetical protein HPP92_020861 [Vanilla planifolia]|uniref:Uncharacterized protein n=1 Tax=Vanilla planifolia TaxID=51239 RepID=A0A835PYL4_VANPL|nr:hypothetical protein HPP92_021158 [Vanilla planifolia]KAG0462385.1 hypothetical protein HPP92_020861 [Vanilla planifolia]
MPMSSASVWLHSNKGKNLGRSRSRPFCSALASIHPRLHLSVDARNFPSSRAASRVTFRNPPGIALGRPLGPLFVRPGLTRSGSGDSMSPLHSGTTSL